MKAVGRAIASQPMSVAVVALFVVFSLIQPNTAKWSNIVNIGVQASVLLIAATGMTFVIMTAGIDISVGSMLYLGAAVLTMPFTGGLPPVVAFLLIVAVICISGAVNGIFVAAVGMPAMVATLATQQAYRGLGDRITGQHMIPVPSGFAVMGTGRVLGVNTPVVVAVVVVVVGHLILRRSVFGRYVQAIGSSESAARNAGIPRTAVLVGVYALAGLLAGVAALVNSGQLGSTQPSVGKNYEMTVITAVVLGGASLFGGKGSIIGTVFGALTLTVVQNGLVLIGASPYAFDLVRGLVLLGALFLTARPHKFSWLRSDDRSSKDPRNAAAGDVVGALP